ncbi:MAG TPA: VWA domain-containing protein, partial [Terriglobales bacterium]|nr:VWA domain-containing protein [Terriglobales bacterium]
MNQLFPNLEFAKPFYLWLLLVLPLLWFRYRDRRVLVLISRSLLLLLLVVILADPQTTSQQSHSEERIFAYDLSRSTPPGLRRWMGEATKSLAPSRDDRIYAFAAKSAQFPGLKEALNAEAQSMIDPEKTNLEDLLASVLALPAAPRSLLLFTDGWETEGNVERLLPAAAAAGIKIYPMLPPGRLAIANIAVTKLIAPSQGNSGENINFKVVVDNQNDRAVDGTLTLTRNGQLVKSDNVKLAPGSQTFSFQTAPAEGGLTAYQATFATRDSESDLYPADNSALTWVSVHAKAKVLIINGQAGGTRYLEEIIRRQGFEVVVRTPGSAPSPAGYKVVIFNNVERDKFPPGYFATVERHVADGNSFMMLGADASFAPASYRQTPIEKILPVEPKEPPKSPEQNRAVVLVIDKSGSMRDENRMLYAKEAAKAVARQLRDIDLLGVVGFDDSPFVVVYLETMARLRGVIDAQIDRLKPGGQTYFLPALIEAKRQLERVNASRKHIILLSDGVTRGSQGELVDLIGVMKNDLKITVSSVAISNDADVRIMKRISQYGGGLFHHVVDPSSLPQIVLEQLQDKQREEPQENRPLIPVPATGSELLSGFGVRTYPALLGFMETELKRGAQLDLQILRDDRRVPLLASWRYGRGKAIALTTDMEGRWSRNWITWANLQGFWGKVLEWLSPNEEVEIPAHDARVSFADNRTILDLAVYEDASANSQFRFAVSGKSGKSEGNLTKFAPGHYQAVLPISAAGSYRIDLTEDRGGRRIAF